MNKALKKYYSNNKLVFAAILVIGGYTYCKFGNNFLPIEQLAIPSAIGYDIENKDGEVKYILPFAIYNYPDGSVSSITITGEADTVPRTRGARQLEATGKFLLGMEKVSVMSENASRFGIKSFLEILWANRTVNDNGFMVVSKQSPEEILKLKIEGYPSSGDYMENLIRHINDFNFYSDNYKLIDVFVREYSEGRNVVLPYIEIKDDKLKVTGLALFKKDKMIKSIGIEEARILNFLRENKIRGIIELVKSPNEYLTFYGTSKKSVECKKVGDKFIFNIKLKLKGEVLSNLMYKNLTENPEQKKQIEKALSKEVETLAYDFIKKMQSDYGVDCLELGRYAVEKYGRRKNIDWDEVVSQSEINVSAEVTVTEIGRGDL
jgi:Ger(x)C family germination protein